MWIARSKDGSDLSLHNNKPKWERIKGEFHDYTAWNDNYEHPLYLDEKLYPEISFDNSPQQVELLSVNETVAVKELLECYFRKWYEPLKCNKFLKNIQQRLEK